MQSQTNATRKPHTRAASNRTNHIFPQPRHSHIPTYLTSAGVFVLSDRSVCKSCNTGAESGVPGTESNEAARSVDDRFSSLPSSIWIPLSPLPGSGVRISVPTTSGMLSLSPLLLEMLFSLQGGEPFEMLAGFSGVRFPFGWFF